MFDTYIIKFVADDFEKTSIIVTPGDRPFQRPKQSVVNLDRTDQTVMCALTMDGERSKIK